MKSDEKGIEFIVVGAQKSGTTTLHDLLSGIDGVSLPINKETHFFSLDEKYSLGYTWYLSQFVTLDGVLGEVDPEYLFFPEAASRIGALVDAPKLIFIFRDPCKRAISHYKMSVRRGLENLPFKLAIESESDRKCELDELTFRKNFSYVERGLYADQVERFLEFCPRSEKLFVKFEDLVDENRGHIEIERICDFLCIDKPLTLAGDVQSNSACSPKWRWVNSVLWDKEKFYFFREGFRKITTQRFRYWLLTSMYSFNVTSSQNTGADDFSIPDRVLALFRTDSTRLERLTGLSFSDWGGAP